MTDRVVEVTATSVYLWLRDVEARRQAGENIRHVVLEGSTRSSKTVSLMQHLIIDHCLQRKVTVRCYREDGTTHKGTTIPDFEMVMVNQLGIWNPRRWHKQDKIYTFENGSVFAFGGCRMQDLSKRHGETQDIAWFNEVMEAGIDSWRQVSQRTREVLMYDFNPSFSQHWVFDQVIGKTDTQAERGVAYLHSTYKDNQFLTDQQVHDIEKTNPDVQANRDNGTADGWHWSVYGLGKRGKVSGAIFSLWEPTSEWPAREACRMWGFGLDFGFMADPAALIEVALARNRLWLRQRIYEKHLPVARNPAFPQQPSLIGRMEEEDIPHDATVWADSANPEGIHHLQAAGFNVNPVCKTPDSIVFGIQIMKSFKIMVAEDSWDLRLELEHYRMRPQKSVQGFVKDLPEDKWNHGIDAARYWCLSELPPIMADRQQKMPGAPRRRGRVVAPGRTRPQR